jgi:hypothetical protein
VVDAKNMSESNQSQKAAYCINCPEQANCTTRKSVSGCFGIEGKEEEVLMGLNFF